VFGWPAKSQKLEQLYPTNLLETGYDIMFFWVFRMVGMCYAFSEKLPFSQIVFHGLIRDSKGRKMSKSLGNVIDPIDMIQGVSLEELKSRILNSNLNEKEKATSVKVQEKTYPKGIEAIGSDALRMACLTQDFKS
jgi:valyl-tRNA synthetase